MKAIFLAVIMMTFSSVVLKAQKIDSIYVHLYTDSLKRGTFNYINIDGLLHNGRFLPLDSTELILEASDGNWQGNSLWLDQQFAKDKVTIKVTLRENPSIFKKFDVYIKQKADEEKLPTVDEVIHKKTPAHSTGK